MDSERLEKMRVGNVLKQPVLLTNTKIGYTLEFSSMTDAAKYLEISRAALWYFLKNLANTGSGTIKGYSISKITDSHVKVNRKYLQLKVTDVDTNEVIIYPSLTLAAEALGVNRASILGYLAKKRTNAYKNKYYFKLV